MVVYRRFGRLTDIVDHSVVDIAGVRLGPRTHVRVLSVVDFITTARHFPGSMLHDNRSAYLWNSAKCISIAVGFSWSMFDYKIVLFHEFDPSGLLPDRLWHFTEPE